MTVVIQGQGQTTGQLQLIPQGVTILPGPGQQLMQAAMPNGTVQRFLFTPLATTATTASTTTTTTVSTTTAGRTWGFSETLHVITTSCGADRSGGPVLIFGRMYRKPISLTADDRSASQDLNKISYSRRLPVTSIRPYKYGKGDRSSKK